MKQEYELILGLEVHLHLRLNSKMFCRCSADMYGSEPNTHTCPVCLGLPGALPVPNGKAVEFTQRIGLALNCKLNTQSKFDRKNYFYPDLPKGYQISQYDEPLCYDGTFSLSGIPEIRIERVHLEEDTGKSIHKGDKTFLDFNKSGVALVEIVTAPDFRDVARAVAFCKEIQRVVRYLGVSDADMEKGQLRLEANISVRKKGDTILPDYKVEVKNINSFKFLEKAVQFECARQSDLWEKGEKPVQENRGWDDIKQVTLPQREKEEAHDYRYFPEPDIPPMSFSKEYLDGLRSKVLELPSAKMERFSKTFGLSSSYAEVLCEKVELSEKFESLTAKADPLKVAHLLVNKVECRELSEEEILLRLEGAGNKFLGREELTALVLEALAENVRAVEDFKKGKTNALAFLVGSVMRKAKGSADPKELPDLIKEQIR